MKLFLDRIVNFISDHKIFSVLVILSCVSCMRTLLLPLAGDEITYASIARNIIFHGEYYHNGTPSTITPSIPFQIALFFNKSNPYLGFALSRISNGFFLIVGLYYLYRYLKSISLSANILHSIILLTIVNSNLVVWSLKLYPETLLFCFFWMFIYNLTIKPVTSRRDIILILIPSLVLITTRYVFAVLGLLLAIKYLKFFRDKMSLKDYKSIFKSLGLVLICSLPVLLWFKYVLSIETELKTGISYFHRFKDNNILFNIKAGLGLIQHNEVNKINGIPAFANLFLPITGFRNWTLSVLLLMAFAAGYVVQFTKTKIRFLFLAILLIMAGLIFAGTGFSRYWLPMLPGFILGFYFFLNFFNFRDRHFLLLAKIVAAVYVVNELRLDIMIINNLM